MSVQEKEIVNILEKETAIAPTAAQDNVIITTGTTNTTTLNNS